MHATRSLRASVLVSAQQPASIGSNPLGSASPARSSPTDASASDATVKTDQENLKRLKYREAIEQVHVYNSKLLLDRRLRMPYIDSQTGLAHQDCHLWVSRVQRCPPTRDGQVYSYPARRWRCHKRPDFTGVERPPAKQQKDLVNGNLDVDAVAGSDHPLGDTAATTASEHANVSPSIPQESATSIKQEVAEFPIVTVTDTAQTTIPVLTATPPQVAESYEMDYEDYWDDDYEEPEEYYSDEEYGKKNRKRKAPKPKSKSKQLALKLANQIHAPTKEELGEMTEEERSKPHNCQICGKRYKNQQGLRYHYEHFDHDADPLPDVPNAEPLPSDSKVTTPEQTRTGEEAPPPGHVTGSKRKKGSPPSLYCDFCLGDGGENKKSGSSEELISCSDCGRSGHPTCLQFNDVLIDEVKKYRWQCIECKCCCVCGTSDNDEQLLFCDDCDRGYHMYCLKPPIDEPPEGSWMCQLCNARVRGEDVMKVAVLPHHMDLVYAVKMMA